MEPHREHHVRKLTKAWILMSKMWRKSGLSSEETLERALNSAPEEWIYAAIQYWGDDTARTAPNFADFSGRNGFSGGGLGESPPRQSRSEKMGLREGRAPGFT